MAAMDAAAGTAAAYIRSHSKTVITTALERARKTLAKATIIRRDQKNNGGRPKDTLRELATINSTSKLIARVSFKDFPRVRAMAGTATEDITTMAISFAR